MMALLTASKERSLLENANRAIADHTDKAPIVKQPLRSPPSVRAVAPPGVGDKKMLSLADLRGSRTRGAWRLVIGNQNDRAGILLNWSLRVTPGKEMRNGS